MMSPIKDLWDQAIQKELAAHDKNGTWKIVPSPGDRNIVTCKWVFKVKYLPDGSIDKYKARLVARGFSQKPGEDFGETYAPVVS